MQESIYTHRIQQLSRRISIYRVKSMDFFTYRVFDTRFFTQSRYINQLVMNQKTKGLANPEVSLYNFYRGHCCTHT